MLIVAAAAVGSAIVIGVLVMLAMALLTSARAQSQPVVPLVADLSKHLVAITAGFTGTDVLLFGATDGPGDVVLVVRGPLTRRVVRKKEVWGVIWANRDSVTYDNVPAFYQVFASRPLDDIAQTSVLARHQIGTEHLAFTVADQSVTESFIPGFRAALVRLKQKQHLYGDRVLPVTMLANRLFRAELHFPSNVPTGSYSVEVYLFRDGDVVSAEITPLVISKTGIGADLYDFAHQQSILYGLAAVAVAIGAGWLAAAPFRRA